MNLQLVFAIATTLGILLSSALLPFQLNSIYADESETNTEQGLGQENIGSGDSINSNCAENLITTESSISCLGVSGPGPVVMPTIDISNVRCTETGIAAIAKISGIEHDSDELTLTLRVIQAALSVDVAEATIPANAPNPAEVFVSFTIPRESGILPGQAVLLVIADDEVLVAGPISIPECSQ